MGFGAAEGSDSLAASALSLNYFHNTKKSIVPGVPSTEEAVLNASSTFPHVTFSFHVLAADEIRCYFYTNGQSARFLARDIKLVLPLFFVNSEENKEFAEGKEMLKIIDRIDGKLRDEPFERFLKDNKVECPLKDLKRN